MKEAGHGKIDEKGRPVRIMQRDDGGVESYYTGRDAEGVIQLEGKREFLDVDGERRYWGGIIEPLPNDRRIQSLKDFTFMSIKPDGMRIGIRKMMEYLIGTRGVPLLPKRPSPSTKYWCERCIRISSPKSGNANSLLT